MSTAKLKALVETITPEMASEILLGNTHNRDYSKATCQRYLREMVEGRWQLNGEPIIIADTGRLMDGQHRLNAMEQYGKPLDFLVVRGMDEAAFTTIDTGVARGGKDVLSIQKVHNAKDVAAVVRICLQYERNTNLMSTKITFSNDEILQYYNAHAELLDRAILIAAKPALKRRLCPTATGMLMVLCAELRDKVEQFLLALETGANLEQGNPILTLRNRLEREKEGLGKVALSVKIALMFKAWNAWVTGKVMPKIVFAPEKESFPKPIATVRQLSKFSKDLSE